MRSMPKRRADLQVAHDHLRSHALQALALETAEGAAEWLHRRIRELWGFPDPPETTMKDRFAARWLEFDPTIVWEKDFRPSVTIFIEEVIHAFVSAVLAVAPYIARRHADRPQHDDHG